MLRFLVSYWVTFVRSTITLISELRLCSVPYFIYKFTGGHRKSFGPYPRVTFIYNTFMSHVYNLFTTFYLSLELWREKEFLFYTDKDLTRGGSCGDGGEADRPKRLQLPFWTLLCTFTWGGPTTRCSHEFYVWLDVVISVFLLFLTLPPKVEIGNSNPYQEELDNNLN